MLRHEEVVLRELQGTRCPVAAYIEIGRDVAGSTAGSPTLQYLVMELLGDNLSELRKATPQRHLSLRTVATLGLQMVDALQARPL